MELSARQAPLPKFFITLTARELNPDIIIANRANAELSARQMEHAGASHVVCPFLTAEVDFARAIVKPNLSDLPVISRTRRPTDYRRLLCLYSMLKRAAIGIRRPVPNALAESLMPGGI